MKGNYGEERSSWISIHEKTLSRDLRVVLCAGGRSDWVRAMGMMTSGHLWGHGVVSLLFVYGMRGSGAF